MTHVLNTSLKQIENQELLQKLIDGGFGHLVDAFLLNDSRVYTRKGRLNKSGACRVLGCKPKDLEDAMLACQQILQKDFIGDEENNEDEIELSV